MRDHGTKAHGSGPVAHDPGGAINREPDPPSQPDSASADSASIRARSSLPEAEPQVGVDKFVEALTHLADQALIRDRFLDL
jgi:hypothetical protein